MVRICERCSKDFTDTRFGPGRPPPYCSDSCKSEAQNSLAATRMKRMRKRQAEKDTRNWWEKPPVGRPRKLG
jgi:hypothetical protein